MRMRLLVAGALVGVAACNDVTEPARKAASGPQISAAVATISCVITVPMPSPVMTWVPVGAPVRGSVCSIAWEMTEPLVFSTGIVAQGFVFRQFDIASQVPGVRIPTFAVSYNNLASQGLYQNGPIEITFSQPVDAFSMDFLENCDGNTGRPCKTHLHRIVARNASGSVLLDTLAGTLIVNPTNQHVFATIERVGIRSVSVHGDSVGKDIDGVTTTVIPGWYTLSFRPDSSCPPSGDNVLDSKQVRDAIYNAFANSGTPPNFIEHGGDIYKMTDGTYKAFPRSDPTASACTYSTISPANEPPLPFGAQSRWAYFHSHAPEGSYVVGCWDAATGTMTNGNTNNQPTGGLSPGDWGAASSQGFFVYAYDGTRVWRGDIGVNSALWKKNPNKWKHDAKGCFIP